MLALSLSTPVHAQQAPASTAGTDTLEEVVVTGIRKGIADAVSAKKASSSIVEAVSAEDIGKLPDASIAESIARLPGIAAQRTNGRAQTLSVRGLGPDFTVTTLNGREQASVNDNRTVEFDQYPSELVSAVKIFKTPDAGMANQGIAGTANIETVRPLAFGSRVSAVTLRRDQDQLKAQVPGDPDGGNRASGMYIDQFMDRTLGVAFGAAYNKTPYGAQTREPWGYASNTNDPLASQGLPLGDEVIGGDKDGVKSAYYERTALMGTVEYKPNDHLHMVFDAYHSDFKELQEIRRMEYGTIWAGATLSTIGSTVGNRVTSGTFTNIPFLVVENYNNDRRAHLDSLGWNTDLKLTEDWGVNGDLSWNRVHRTDLRLESTAGLGRNGSTEQGFPPPPPETANFTTDGTGVTHFATTGNYSDYNTTFLTDPGVWGGGPTRSGYLGNPSVTDEIKQIKLSAHRVLSGSFLSEVSFGVGYEERTKSKYEWQSVLYLQGGVSHATVPVGFQKGIIDTSFFGNPYGMINYDAYGLLHSGFWNTIDARVDPNANPGDASFDFTNTWSVKEKLTTPYIKLDIDTRLLDMPLTGNIGVQAQTADQTSNIFYQTGNVGSTIIGTYKDVGAKYTDVLPSMNLTWSLPHDMKLRAAAAVAVARPRMDELAGGASTSVVQDGGNPIVFQGKTYYWSQDSGGNPQLKPWKANTFDLSFEKYFSNKGYLSAAVYYKQLKSFIAPHFQFVDFTGVPLPPTSGGQTFNNADQNRLGIGKIAANGSGGYIRGLELTASLPFDTLTPVLHGFGLIVSAAFNQSEISPDPGLNVTVPGLSPKVINTTLYYERGGFSARVSDRYRGGFIGEVPAFDSSLSYNNVKTESIVDAQVGYTWDTGVMKGLSVNLSGSNLTNEPFVLSNVGASSFDVIKYEKYGAVYSLMATYKF